MVYSVVAVEDNLANRDYGIAVLRKFVEYPREGFRRMYGGVVEQDYRAGLNLARDALCNLGG
ncbi:MAG: hypothetical protein LBM98_05485 [Oscillospiraceae bacterium]|nr:hypothetical protein [Oscillospiraceae bacterium]